MGGRRRSSPPISPLISTSPFFFAPRRFRKMPPSPLKGERHYLTLSLGGILRQGQLNRFALGDFVGPDGEAAVLGAPSLALIAEVEIAQGAGDGDLADGEGTGKLACLRFHLERAKRAP